LLRGNPSLGCQIADFLCNWAIQFKIDLTLLLPIDLKMHLFRFIPVIGKAMAIPELWKFLKG